MPVQGSNPGILQTFVVATTTTPSSHGTATFYNSKCTKAHACFELMTHAYFTGQIAVQSSSHSAEESRSTVRFARTRSVLDLHTRNSLFLPTFLLLSENLTTMSIIVVRGLRLWRNTPGLTLSSSVGKGGLFVAPLLEEGVTGAHGAHLPKLG